MEKLKIHIVGGRGQMGNWLKNFLESRELKVSISGRKNHALDLIAQADIIFISVPISKARKVIEDTAKQTKSNSLLVDLSSVKENVVKALIQTKKSAIAIHPLFGPTIISLENQKIIFCHIKNNPLVTTLKNIFKEAGTQIIEMTPKEHDLKMAHIQALTHFINLSLAKVLLKNKIDISGKVSTPVFLSQLATLNRVLSQSPNLLAEIEINNPSFEMILKQFIEFQSQLLQLIQNKDSKKLESEYQLIRNSLDISKKAIIEKKLELKSYSSKIPGKNKVAYLGPIGTFSHQATILVAKKSDKLIPCKSIYDIFNLVSNNTANYGIVPAENSTEGTVRETLDYLLNFDLRANLGFEIPIHQNLLSEDNLSNIKKIVSHPQALAQCREWIRNNLPDAVIESSSSTISSAATLEKGCAIIGSDLAAKMYQLKVIAKNIEDNNQNTTKFYVISKNLVSLNNKSNRTLLFLTVFNRVGVLRDILNVFADSNVNLSKIESRPNRDKKWDYHFFIEVDVSLNNQKLTQVLDILKQYCPIIKVLGAV